MDEDTLSTFFAYELDALEEALSCTCCSLGGVDAATSRALGLPESPGREYVAVGTAYVIPSEFEPSKGRILVFSVDRLSDNERDVTLIAQVETAAAVFSMAPIMGKLAAGVGPKVTRSLATDCT